MLSVGGRFQGVPFHLVKVRLDGADGLCGNESSPELARDDRGINLLSDARSWSTRISAVATTCLPPFYLNVPLLSDLKMLPRARPMAEYFECPSGWGLVRSNLRKELEKITGAAAPDDPELPMQERRQH